MPGMLLHQGATVLCLHAGQAQPTAPNPRVKVSGQPVVTQIAPYTIAGCPFTVPPGAPMPCVTAQWVTGALRVRAGGVLRARARAAGGADDADTDARGVRPREPSDSPGGVPDRRAARRWRLAGTRAPC